MNSAIRPERGTPIFSENSLSDRNSPTVTICPVLVLRFCSISSTFFSAFFFVLSLFDLVNHPSSSNLFLCF